MQAPKSPRLRQRRFSKNVLVSNDRFLGSEAQYVERTQLVQAEGPECFNVAESAISESASCSDSDFDFFGPFERGETSPSPPDVVA